MEKYSCLWKKDLFPITNKYTSTRKRKDSIMKFNFLQIAINYPEAKLRFRNTNENTKSRSINCNKKK